MRYASVKETLRLAPDRIVRKTRFGVLQQTFEDRGSFTMETTTAPPGMPTRTFASFRAAAAECADSRVRLGWHFRYSTDAGLALGRQIARYIQSRSLRTL